MTITITDFYNAYLKAIKKLYGNDNAIKQNGIKPTNESGFKRTMNRRASVVVTTNTDYNKADIENIINDLNEKYEEYDKGDGYTEVIRNKGKIRYVMLSNILRETLSSLGCADVISKIKYAEVKKNDEDILKETLTKAGVKVKKEDTTVIDTIKKLDASVIEVEKFLDTPYDRKDIPAYVTRLDQMLKALGAVLKTVESISNQTDDLKASVDKAKAVYKKLEEARKAVVDKVDKQEDTPIPNSGDDVQNMIPAVLNAIPALLKKGQSDAESVIKLKAEIESLNEKIKNLEAELGQKKSALPDNEDELFEFAKAAINRVSDKAKLKDLGMVIMMKAL